MRNGENLAEAVKSTGKLRILAEKTNDGLAIHGVCGIGHTRWATYGESSQTNAHPHASDNCIRSGSSLAELEVVGVHNGIIENYHAGSIDAINKTLVRVRGSYALEVLFTNHPEVTGDKLEAIHMLPGYTHNIINLSDTQNLVTVMWANESFDPGHPDTFGELV